MKLTHYWVRLGRQARLACVASEVTQLARGAQVVIQTPQGLELGEVLTHHLPEEHDPLPQGTLLRAMTGQDRLLQERLERNLHQAVQACQNRLEERAIPVLLLDAEFLFDGTGLIFYFLGPELPELAAIANELAELHSVEVGFRDFSSLLTEGCGPGCGTSEGAGCGTSERSGSGRPGGGCGSCQLHGSCGT